MKQPLLAIGGATGSGKTALAIKLAKHFPQIVLLSADSRQVYKYLNIGSAKVGQGALDCRLTGQAEPVRIAGGKSQFLIDVAEPNTNYTLADYQQDAYRLIRACWEQGKIPLIVGGTGLYLQAVTEGYVIEGKIDQSLREELEKLSVEELQARLAKIGHEITTTDLENKRRLIRAIERAESGVNAVGDKRKPITKNVQVFVLERSWEEQRALAPAMVRERLELGLVDEVKMLLANNVDKEWLRGMGLSYRLVLEMLDGKFPESELEPKMVHAFRQLMRRQRTWFNRMPNAQKLSAPELYNTIAQLINPPKRSRSDSGVKIKAPDGISLPR